MPFSFHDLLLEATLDSSVDLETFPNGLKHFRHFLFLSVFVSHKVQSTFVVNAIWINKLEYDSSCLTIMTARFLDFPTTSKLIVNFTLPLNFFH